MAVLDIAGGEAGRCVEAGRIGATERLAASGANFGPYCWICIAALRTYGRPEVIATVEAAYEAMQGAAPATRWVYGEIGFPWGGPFPPHRTHRDGLSVDFMVPLADGRRIGTHAGNRFGYDAEFDAAGFAAGHGRIDFAALGLHLLALEGAARARGGRIERVILAPDLQDDLARSEAGARALATLRFNRRQAWVRHDDHYHVTFAFPCA